MVVFHRWHKNTHFYFFAMAASLVLFWASYFQHLSIFFFAAVVILTTDFARTFFDRCFHFRFWFFHHVYSPLAQLLLLLLALADFSKTALRFTEASFGSASFCLLVALLLCLLMRTFNARSPKLPFSLHRSTVLCFALQCLDPGRTRFTAASLFHLLTLPARCENLYGASELPPSQFIRYRDPRRCILRIFHPNRRLSSSVLLQPQYQDPRPFLLPGATVNVPRNSLTTRAGTQEAASFVDVADIITILCARVRAARWEILHSNYRHSRAPLQTGNEIGRRNMTLLPAIVSA